MKLWKQNAMKKEHVILSDDLNNSVKGNKELNKNNRRDVSDNAGETNVGPGINNNKSQKENLVTENDKIKRTNTSSQIKEDQGTILNHLPDVGLPLVNTFNPDEKIGATETIDKLSLNRISKRNDIYTKYRNDDELPIHFAKLKCSRPVELEEENNTRFSSSNSHYESDVDNNIIKLNTKRKYTKNEKIKQTNTSPLIKEDKGTILNHLPDVGIPLVNTFNPDVKIGATETIDNLSLNRISERNDIYTKHRNDDEHPIHFATLKCSRPLELEEENNTRFSSPNSHYDSDVDNNIIQLNTKSKYTKNEKIKQTNTSSQIKEDQGTILNHLPDVGFALANTFNTDVNIGATETIETLSIDRMSGSNDI